MPVTSGVVGGVTGKWLSSKKPDGTVVLFVHGDANVLGSPRSRQRFVKALAKRLNAEAFVPEYRPATQHRLSVEDLRFAYAGLLDQGVPADRIVVAGDAAGGRLALSLAMRMRDMGIEQPSALALICPWLDASPDVAVTQTPIDDDPLRWVPVLEGAVHTNRDPTLLGVSAPFGDLSGLPPIVLLTASQDTRAADGALLADRSPGHVDVAHRHFSDLRHGFRPHPGLFADAEDAVEWLAATIAMRRNGSHRQRVAIVGAGMSGILMAIKMRTAGYEDLVIYEKAADVGGTWRDNRYPGLTCDVPARQYTYSFAPNPNWSQFMAPGPEIHQYFQSMVEKYDLRRFIKFNAEVADAEWRADGWHIRTSEGSTSVADVLVTACGFLHHPHIPHIPGIDQFGGKVFHSARWDDTVELAGRRVGIIGTGSTGAQLTAALADYAGTVKVFQRTPQWVLWFPNHSYSRLSRLLMRSVPKLNRVSHATSRLLTERVIGSAAVKPGWERRILSWWARTSLRLGIRDRELRRKLTPAYQPGCKRIVASSRVYRAIRSPNVELVTEPIDYADCSGIVTEDGELHELDAIILATGFDAHAYMRPMQIRGERGITLEEVWANGPIAYRTVAIPGFPNLFTLVGPHSPVGNYSVIGVAETQSRYIIRWLDLMRRHGITSVVPTNEATDDYNTKRRAAAPNTLAATGCQSWYIGQDGTPEIWPWTPDYHRAMLAEPVLEHFRVDPA